MQHQVARSGPTLGVHHETIRMSRKPPLVLCVGVNELAHRVFATAIIGRARVEELWAKVCTVGPYDCTENFVYGRLGEPARLPKRFEQLAKKLILYVDLSPGTVIECHIENVWPQHLHADDGFQDDSPAG